MWSQRGSDRVETAGEGVILLTVEETNYLCRIGPGTPMGNLMRRYWTPILLSKELLEHDGAPLRSRILGEDLVAFRDTNGDVGLLDNHCPHRRASLFFGRNEECGLRCVYHGWKFDKDGNCVDMPSEPAESNFKDKVRIKSYPVKEGGGLIWAYMGPPQLEPPMPLILCSSVPFPMQEERLGIAIPASGITCVLQRRNQ